MSIEYEFFTPVRDRMMRLPYDARMLLHLGGLQRCAALLVRSALTTPERAPAVPAVEAALAFAWANTVSGDAVQALALAEQLAGFEPQDIEDEVNEGDSSYSTCVVGLGKYLRAIAEPADHWFFFTFFDTPAQLYGTWFNWSEHHHGRTFDRDSRAYSSAVLLERATQVRQLEWLERTPVTAELADRIRRDSLERGAELVRIVDEWWDG